MLGTQKPTVDQFMYLGTCRVTILEQTQTIRDVQ